MRNISLFKGKKILGAAIAVVLFMICLLPVQAAFAIPFFTHDKTIGVDGRILSKDKTGDCSDWVEIARNGENSLIVRKNFINIYPQAVRYGDFKWQYTAFGLTSNYVTSTVRDKINDWFNGCASPAADNLHCNARLRDYTMQHNAKITLGTCNSKAAMINGISRPTIYQVGVGDDIAFALSYSEAANFVSKSHFMRLMNPSIQPSNHIAVKNYNKINIPDGYIYGMWLRSPGDVCGTAGALSNNTDFGRAFQSVIANNNNEFGLVYPALWVDSDIFGDKPNQNKVRPGKPHVVNGRILTKDKTGDCSDWVEVAQSDCFSFSLIVRKNFINIYTQAARYGDYTWQYTAFGLTTAYEPSNPRKFINAWFNGCPVGAGDSLPLKARMRNFAVQNNAKHVLGTCCDPKTSMFNGLSRPTIYQVGIGDDIAFAMSYGEAASFVSNKHFMRLMNPSLQPSCPFAVMNYSKICIPPGDLYGMWLRSPGDCPNTAASLGNNDYFGAVFQFSIPNHPRDKGLVYPAMWVGSGIFDNKATIKVYHRDAISLELLEEEEFKVNPGSYGPYNAKSFPGYGAGYLAPYSDAPSGTVRADETKNITYLYPPETITVDVVYHPNGGEGSINVVSVPINTSYTIEDQGYYHSDSSLVFDGWNTKPDGTGDNYENDDTITVTDNIILYAKWKKDIQPMVYVIYHPGTGRGNTKIVSVPINTWYTIEDNPGYTNGSVLQPDIFDGWDTYLLGGGYPYKVGQSYLITNTITLFAQWIPGK
jgi:uncharacterized repeat protein (TIGR02543 family)